MAYVLTTVCFDGETPTAETLGAALAARTGLVVSVERLGAAAESSAALVVVEFGHAIDVHRHEGRLLVDLNDVHPYLADALLLTVVDLGGRTAASMPSSPVQAWAQTPKWRYSVRLGVGRVMRPLLLPVSILFELIILLPAALLAKGWRWATRGPVSK